MRPLRWVWVSLGLAFGLSLALAGQAFQPSPAIHTVFIIVMENLQWADVEGSPDAPYINQTLLPQAAHADQYLGEPYLHPSLPNYLVLEAGTNFGIQDDLPPAINQQNTTQHLTAALERAGLTWKAWVEDISGNTCPLVDVNLYTDAVNPTVFFDDVINSASNCIAHERPFGELAAALNHNTVPNLNWIIPDLCDDAHSCPLGTGDQWLSQVVPMIQASPAYQDGGAIFITWDEDQDGVEDQPLGLIVASPAAKPGYFNTLRYTHASTLRTIEEIFHLSPYFGEAATANDLSDLFNTSGLALSPLSLTFAPQPLGATSPPQTVAVNNQGSVAVTITGVSASGDFTQTNNCPASLAPQASCAITVQFTPQSTSTEQGQLSLDDDAPGSPQLVSLSGQGQGGIAQLSAASLDFGTLAVGDTSPPQALTLTNAGGAPLTLGSIHINWPFSQSSPCPAALAPGASCTLQVRFTPTAAETSYGQLSFNDNASDSPQQVKLRGTGQGALALVSAETLHWGNQAVGSSSPAQTLTLQNGGNIPLAVASITVSGPFSLVSGCAATVAPGTLCGLHVQFVPQVPGPAAGALAVADNAPGSPQQVALSGTGQGAIAVLTPATLHWTDQSVGSTSPAQTVTVQNQGNISLALASVAVSGPFTLANSCGPTLAPGAQCTLQVQFSPLAPGPAAGTLSLADNAPGAPQQVALGGSGEGPVALLSAATLNLGAQAVGSSSPAQTVTLQNPGNTPLTLSAVTVTGPFTLINGCGPSLAAGAQCALQVQFAPLAPGPASGTLTLADNATGSPQQVALSGTGQGALALLSAAALDLGAQAVGSASPAQSLTLQNPGTIPLALGSLAVSGPFTLINGCGPSLAAGAQCALQVQFNPLAPGTASGVLTLADNAQNSPQQVALSGTGQGALALLSAATLNWGDQALGSSSPPQTLTLQNPGNIPLALGSLAVSGPFTLTNGCGSSLAAGAQCALQVQFAPLAPGPATGALALADNAPGSPHVVALAGTGLGPVAQPAAAHLDFGVQLAGTSGAPFSLTLANTGNAPLQLASAQASGAFTAAAACSAPVPPGGSCAIAVQFAPAQAGPAAGSLRLVDNAGVQTIAITGTGGDLELAASAAGANWSVVSGQSAYGGVLLTSLDGFADASLTLACTGAPALAACTVTPATVALAANGQASAQVIVTTQAAAGLRPLLPAALAWLLLLLPLAAKRRRLGWLAPALLALSGCGGLPAPPRVPPGAYALQLVATTTQGATRTLPLPLRVR